MLGYVPPATVSEVLQFHIHWDVLGLIAVLVIGYIYGIRALAPRYAPQGEPIVTFWQGVSYFSGVAILFLVTGWPIHDIGEGSLFFFHMIEHLAIALVVPPLLLLGTPWWFLRVVVRPIMPALRILTKPIVALVVFNTVLAVIHIPAVLESMITNEFTHVVLHVLLFVTAILMWWPVIGPIPDLPRLPPFQRMGYLFLQSLVPTIPASFMTLTERPIYPFYADLPRMFGLEANSDQVIAGLIMKLGGAAILWLAIAIIFFRWAAEEERHEVGVAPTPR
jgi:putative membrane protein